MEDRPLEYEPRRQPPAADLRSMFFLLLPGSLFVIILFAADAVEQVGGRAFGMMGLLIILLPVVPICLIFALVHALRRKKGFITFVQGVALNGLLVLVIAVIFHMRGYRL